MRHGLILALEITYCLFHWKQKSIVGDGVFHLDIQGLSVTSGKHYYDYQLWFPYWSTASVKILVDFGCFDIMTSRKSFYFENLGLRYRFACHINLLVLTIQPLNKILLSNDPTLSLTKITLFPTLAISTTCNLLPLS